MRSPPSTWVCPPMASRSTIPPTPTGALVVGHQDYPLGLAGPEEVQTVGVGGTGRRHPPHIGESAAGEGATHPFLAPPRQFDVMVQVGAGVVHPPQ